MEIFFGWLVLSALYYLVLFLISSWTWWILVLIAMVLAIVSILAQDVIFDVLDF
jgi:hypothetical protein